MKTALRQKTRVIAISLTSTALLAGCAASGNQELHARVNALFDERAVIECATDLFHCTDRKDW